LDAQFSLRASQSGSQGFVPFTLTDDFSQMAAGMLRATQAAVWTQTQGAGGGGSDGPTDVYGAASQASALTQRASLGGTSQSQGGTQGGWTAAGGTQSGTQRSSMAPPPPRHRHTAKGGSASGAGLEQLRRRSLAEAASKRARGRRVALYRTYRDGELPDIEAFSALELLRPLQALVLRDASLARTCFAWLFAEVCAPLPSLFLVGAFGLRAPFMCRHRCESFPDLNVSEWSISATVAQWP
jgi:hypothetical protein